MTRDEGNGWLRDYGIWGLAFGYFACYVPYSALTKALSKGLLPALDGHPIAGFSLLPISVLASTVVMFIVITALGWWRYPSRIQIAGRAVPSPTRWTFLSGLCTTGIILTTTLAYTFNGVSIVFVMLLMRGGLLILAPVIDALTGRRPRWFSWAGLLLSLAALLVAFAERGGYDITVVCMIDIAIYLASYFIRLRFMSKLAKSEDPDANRRYFVEEQMVASPFGLLALGVLAVSGAGEVSEQLRFGFVDMWSSPALREAIFVGVLSQGTGFFGSLIYLDRRENTFCVPVNRSSSILAGVLASYALTLFFDARPPSDHQLVGASLIIGAIFFLTIPPMLEKRRRRRAA